MTGKRVPDSVGKRPPGFSEEVEARAVEAACAGFIPEWGRLPNSEAQDWRSDLSHALAAAAPIIAEAGYRAGIEAARAAVEDCAVDYEGTPITEVHRDDLRDALAALTDTEGRDE